MDTCVLRSWTCVLMMAFAVPGQQVTNATLGGSVEDTSGAAIVGAGIELTEPSGRLVRETRSGDNGAFRFEDVAPGQYVLRVNAGGFETHALPLRLAAGSSRDVVVSLRVGRMTTSVTVEAPWGDPVRTAVEEDYNLNNPRQHSRAGPPSNGTRWRTTTRCASFPVS